MESVDIRDLKSLAIYLRASSSLAEGTIRVVGRVVEYNGLENRRT